MRSVLIDWLIDVHLKFKLRPETLYLAVNLIDRYIACAFIPKHNLQLVGIASLYIAAKYEEIRPPPLKNFLYVTDDAYDKEELIEMEGKIVNSLKFKLTVPTARFFFERFGRTSRLTDKGMSLGYFVLDSMLTDFKVMRHVPSLLAMAAVFIACRVESREGWRSSSTRTPYSEISEVRDCVSEILASLNSNERSALSAAAERKHPISKLLISSKPTIQDKQ